MKAYDTTLIVGVAILLSTLVTPIVAQCPRCRILKNAMRFIDENGECTNHCVWSEIAGSRRGYECGRCGQDVPPVQSGNCRATGYQISLDMTETDPAFRTYFRSATSRWTRIITGDLPPIDSSIVNSRCKNLPRCIDDLHICTITRNIDGPGRILGSAGLDFARNINGRVFPGVGFTFLDSSDIPTLISNGSFQRVIEHEFGHLIGLGLTWMTNGLVDNCVYRLNSRASTEFRTISRCRSTARVPLETGGGRGTICSHWEQSCLQGELMTGYASQPFQLSRITIASLEDLGYQVSYRTADRLTSRDLGSCSCSRRQLRGGSENATSVAHNDNNNTNEEKEEIKPRRRLSDEGYEEAVRYGRQILSEHSAERWTETEGYEYWGNRVVLVYYLEDDEVHDVIVWGGE